MPSPRFHINLKKKKKREGRRKGGKGKAREEKKRKKKNLQHSLLPGKLTDPCRYVSISVWEWARVLLAAGWSELCILSR